MFELKPSLKLKYRSRISLQYRLLCVGYRPISQFHDTCSRFIYFEWNSVQLILHDGKIYLQKRHDISASFLSAFYILVGNDVIGTSRIQH